VNGTNITFRRFGRRRQDGESTTLILLHHGTGCMGSWNSVVNELSERFDTTIAYDRIGFGETEPSVLKWSPNYHQEGADELFGLMDSLEIENATLIGHSDGATISMIAAAIDPSRIRAMVLEAPHVFHGSRYETEYGKDGGFKYFRENVMEKHQDRLRAAFKRDHGDRGQEVLERWYDWWTSMQNMNWDCTNILPNIQCPCLCIHGQNDIFFPIEHTRMIGEMLARGEVKVIENAGHEIHKDRRKKWLEITLGWLAKEAV